MKKSYSQFIRLNGSNFPIVLFFTASLLSTCSSSQTATTSEINSSALVHPLSADTQPLISFADPVRESWIELRSIGSPKEPGILRFNAKSCVEQKFIMGVTLNVLGVGYDVVFEEDSGQMTLATVEDSETKLNGFELPHEFKEDICSNLRDYSGTYLIVKDKPLEQVRTYIVSTLSSLVPDCKSTAVDARGMQCKLDSVFPQAALVKTEEFRKSMIRKWSRQPYILARRNGVVATLAKTATNLADDDGFVKFCRVLQFSLPEELPVVMTSRRWQNALCSGQGELRREAAFFGLAKGTQELDMLRELYERTSRIGLLSVKIPNDAIPGRAQESSRQPLRVTIAPDEEVSKRLVLESKKYLGQSERNDRPRRIVRTKHGKRTRVPTEALVAPKIAMETLTPARSDMCWHPVFGESWGLLRVADGMKLTGNGFNLECGFIYDHEREDESETASLSRYLLQSLSSETEFVLDNGQAKLLRLPEGRYQYTVHVLPANPLDSEDLDEENTPTSKGELAWGTTRAHSIKQW